MYVSRKKLLSYGIYHTKNEREDQKVKRRKKMKKQIITVPSYTTRRFPSEQARQTLRMKSRYFTDRKKEAKKYLCRTHD